MRDTAKSITDLYQRLRPHILRDVRTIAGGGSGAGGGMVAHELSGRYHTGTLLQSQAPWAATKAELAALTDTGMMHAQVHELASASGLGTDHTVSGLTAGHVLRATGATSAAFAAIQDADLPSTIVRTSRQVLAGNGLSGGGNLGSDVTLTVGAGTLISVSTTQVSIASGSAYQYIGTGSGATPSWRNLSELAGDGLASSGVALNVGAGDGLTVSANAIALTTPGTLSVSAANNASGSHTHAITSSSDPGAAASLLASDATGKLTLPLMVASTSVTTPTITAPSGNSLTVGSPVDVILDPTSDLVRMGSGASIQASSYASQTTGWRITDAGEADFRYLFVDEMHAKSFIADLEQALAGGQIIAKSVAMVATAFTLPVAGATGTLRVRDLPSAPNMAVFQSGDFIGLRQFSRAAGSLTIGWAWGTVTSYADGSGANEGTQTWTFTRHATTPGAATGTIAADSLALDFGVSGNGFYEVNAIDGAYGANSPYAQVVTWSSHPATQTVRARFGHLRGIFSVADEFGLYAGSGTSVTDRYIRASSQAVELRNVPLALYDGTNNTLLLSAGAANNSPFMALGATLPTSPLTNSGIWLGKDGSDYEFRVGTVSGGALVKGLHWDGSNLVWKATNTSLDASGNLTASNATLSGQVTATSGAIGGWSIAASGLTATNIGLYSGAANTARVQVGSGSDVAGINAPAASSDIAFWAGDTHANRASADFRVTAAGALYATTGTIAGDFTITSPGRLIAAGGGVVLTATGINVGLYTGIDGGEAPADDSKALAWYDTPGTATGLQVRQYVGKDASSQPHWNVTVNPSGAAPLTMSLWYGGASQNGLWFTNLAQVVGMPGLLLATGSPNTVQVLSGARLQLNSGSAFVATAHLQAGAANTYDIGESGVKWRKLYVQDVVADTISGTSLSGATWRNDASDMYIYSSAAGARTLYIANDGAGVMGLNVEGDIALGGLVDGVDLAAFKSAYDLHNHDSRYYTETELATSGSASVHWNNLTSKPTTFAPSAHVLATTSGLGAEHTVSGLTAGYVLRASSATTAAFAQLAHSDLSGVGVNSHTQIDTHIATSDTHVAHSGVTLTAGDGLTGGGTIAASRTFTLGTPSSLTSTSTNAVTSTSHTHAIDATIARAAITLTAGDGLTGGGDLSANRTFTLGTPSALSATTTNAVTTTSHTHSIATAAAVTLTVASSNGVGSSASLARADHTHAITTSSNPGAAASILATDASGYLQLVRLGIGVSPSVALDVSGAVSASEYQFETTDAAGMRILADTANSYIQFLDGGSAVGTLHGSIGIDSAYATARTNLSALGSNALAVSGKGYFGGNVGIGTTSPESKLHVAGSARLDYGGSYIIENTVGNAATVATVNAGDVLVIGGSNINGFQVGDNDAYIASTGAANARQMVFYAGNAAEAARINASGYLGVGMSAPEARLHIRDSDAGVTFTNVTGLAIENSGSSNSYYALAVKTTGAPNALSLTNAGYLGLGTSSPDYQLDMTGNANIAGTLYVGTDVEIDEDLYVAGGVLQVSAAGTRVGINRVADSQFDLDVAGAIRGQYLVGRHAIQLPSAVGVWHFDGPQPYNLDFSGSNVSHSGITGTNTGGVIYRPGRFGKAVQLAEATTNLVANPSVETGTSGWTAYASGAPTGTRTRVSTQAYSGSYSYEIVKTGGATSDVYGAYVNAYVTTGLTYTFSVWVKVAAISGGLERVWIQASSNVTTALQYIYGVSDWQRIVITTTATGTGGARLYIGAHNCNTATIYVDAVQVEQKDYSTPYCDGSLGDGHSWSGTEHASTSSRTTAYITYSGVMPSGSWSVGWWQRVSSSTLRSGNWNGQFRINGYDVANSLAGGVYSTTGWHIIGRAYDAVSRTFQPSNIGNGYAAAGEWSFITLVYDDENKKCLMYFGFPNAPEANGFVSYEYSYGSGLNFSSAYFLISSNATNSIEVDELFIVEGAMDAKLIRSIYESDAPVFVESSVFHWRSPSRGAQIWVDEFGLWGRTNTGDAMFGLYGGSPTDLSATTTWGGVTVAVGDLVIGSLSTGAVFHWDNSEGAIRIGDKGAEHVFMDGETLEFRNNTRTWASLSGNSFVIGESGSPQVGVGTGGLFFTGASGTVIGGMTSNTIFVGEYANSKSRFEATSGAIKMIWRNSSGVDTTMVQIDASGNASFVGNISASGGSFTGVINIDTLGGIYQGTGSFVAPTTGLKIWNDGGYGRIGGYLAGTVQWYANTDGRLYAGSGNVRLDSTGIAVNADTVAADPNKAYSFLNGSTKVGGLTAVRTSEYTDVVLASNWLEDGTTYAEANRSAYLNLWAFHNGAGKVSEVQILAGATSGASIVLTKLEGSDPSIVITASHIRVTGGVTVGGDAGGLSSTLGLTNSFFGVSTGAGTVKMNGTTYRDSAGWIKMYNGTTAIYVPYWTTITG